MHCWLVHDSAKVEVEKDVWCPRCDQQRLINQLHRWLNHPVMPGIFKAPWAKLATAQPARPVSKVVKKEAKLGSHTDARVWSRAFNHPQTGDKTTLKTTPGGFMPTFMGHKTTPLGGYNHPKVVLCHQSKK